jgi:hypothetical protein
MRRRRAYGDRLAERSDEILRLRALIPESDPRRDPNWKPEQAPAVGEIPQWIKEAKAAMAAASTVGEVPNGIVEAIQAQMDAGRFGPKAREARAKAVEHHSLLTDEERARGKALVEADAKAAGVHPAVAEACERVAANAPKPKPPITAGARVRLITGPFAGMKGEARMHNAALGSWTVHLDHMSHKDAAYWFPGSAIEVCDSEGDDHGG